MAFLNKEQIEQVVSSYRDDPTATMETVAEANNTTVATVRSYLDKARVAIREAADESDEDLGIGVDVESMVQSDVFQKAVADAVAAALSKIGMPQASAANGAPPEWAQFMDKMERLTNSLDVQKPGYQKPLTPDELTLRAEGYAEFTRLLRNAKLATLEHSAQKAVSLGLVPEYVVGEQGYYGNTAQGETLFASGQRIYLTSAPPEDFLAMNDAAAAILQAQLQWLGEPTPSIEELVAQAMMRVRGADTTFIVGNDAASHSADAILIDAERVDVGARRTFGTSVAEPKKVVAGNGAPQGPVFTE